MSTHYRSERWLSALSGWLAQCRWQPLVQLLIWIHRQLYTVDLSEAVISDASGFSCFNEFFTRQLRPGARPIITNELMIVSPCDGRVSQTGATTDGQLLQAKNSLYAMSELLGEAAAGQKIEYSSFATLYLAPPDYHRIHAPCDLQVLETHYIPGRLMSVRPALVARQPRLFSQNERLVITCASAFGRVAIVLVGALLVSGIQTHWHPERYDTPGTANTEVFTEPLLLAKGEELGRFNFGSTIILLLPSAVKLSPYLTPEAPLRYGQTIGYIKHDQR